MKPVIIHADAEQELWQAVSFYESKVAGLGLDFEAEVSRKLVSIQEAPDRYSKTRHGARRCLVQRFPYAIYYLEMPDVIWIVVFAHTRRRPYYWAGRAEGGVIS